MSLITRHLRQASIISLIASTSISRADDLGKTIASCGTPEASYQPENRQDQWNVHYKSHGLWLLYEKDESGWRWFKALDDYSSKEPSQKVILKRLPCAKGMLKANALLPAFKPPTPSLNPVLPSSSGSSFGQYVVGIFGIFLVLFFTLTKKPSKAQTSYAPDQPVKCPHCLSTQIHTEKRGWKLTTGFLGSSKLVMTCLRCGKQFKPAQGV